MIWHALPAYLRVPSTGSRQKIPRLQNIFQIYCLYWVSQNLNYVQFLLWEW